MRIDQTRVAIRERSWLDNLDLALHFIRVNFRSCLSAAVAGAAPFILLNVLMVSLTLGSSLSEEFEFDMAFLGTVLVLLEVPLATAPLTLLLGQVMFVEQANAGKIARDLLSSLPQLLLYQVVLRILPVITLPLGYAIWPYLNEIILLERNPLVSRPGQLSTRKRSSLLHAGGSGDYIIRTIGAGIISLLLIGAIWTASVMLLNMLFGLQLGRVGQIVLFQCTIWTVVMYFTVARFLTYLDQRIRNEGWEVELSLRAERQRLLRQVA
jgi:hypothetical protein